MQGIAAKDKTLPDHVPPHRVVDFDTYLPFGSGGADASIYDAWSRVRPADGSSMVWSPYNDGHWIATRADAIRTVFSDHTRFSSQFILIPKGAFSLPILPQELDPPVHQLYRAIIMPWFSPRRIVALERQARTTAIELIEGIAAQGRCEFIEDFASPFPISIVMALVDLPMTDRIYLQTLVSDQNRHPDVNRRVAAFDEFSGYLADVADKRAREPGDDLISAVVHARIDGKPLDRRSIMGMISSIVGGGLDTVSAVLGYTALFLARNPEHRQQLIDRPDLIDNGSAVEELLRRFAVAAPARTVAADIEYDGVLLKAGDLVQVPTFLHNLDGERFGDPERVDFTRREGLHGSFGFGEHRCPGANLTRVELRVFLKEWIARIPHFAVADEAAIAFQGGLTLSVAALPLCWTPA